MEGVSVTIDTYNYMAVLISLYIIQQKHANRLITIFWWSQAKYYIRRMTFTSSSLYYFGRKRRLL